MGRDNQRRRRKVKLTRQIASTAADIPKRKALRRWAAAALAGYRGRVALTIRVVDEAESAALNLRYRGKPGPTNVLSFPLQAPPGVKSSSLGDLVVCAPLVAREAADQGKPAAAHWAHLVVHGVLHLLGYDHLEPAEAAAMESLETAVLARLGIADPYREAAP